MAGNLAGTDSCDVTVEGKKKDAGIGYTATATELNNPNYRLPSAVTTSFNIMKKSVTVSDIKANDKTYDGTTAAKFDADGASFTGKLDGDMLTVTAAGAFEDANVGSGKTVNITRLTLGGKSAGNYALAESGQQTKTTASIKAKSLGEDAITITLPPETFIYDGNLKTYATVTVKDGETVIPDSEYTVSYKNNVNAGTPTSTAPPTVTVTANAGGNYDGSKSELFTIGKAGINPYVLISDWEYGESASDPVLSEDGNPGNGKVTYEYKPKGATDSEYGVTVPTEVGEYTVRATIPETDNYKGAEATADFAIHEKSGGTPADVETAVYEVFQNADGNWSEPVQPETTAKGSYTVPARQGFRATACSLGTYQAKEAERSAISQGGSVSLGNSEKLYVYYARNVRQLTFYADSEGKTALKSESVLYGAPLAQYANVKPENRANYTFAAWSPDANIQVSALRDKQGNLTEGVTLTDWSGTMPDEDINAYPIWIHDRLNVRLNLGAYDGSNGENWYDPTAYDTRTPAQMDAAQGRDFTVDLNERIAMKKLVAATRTGYTLAGWYTQGGVLWNGNNWAPPNIKAESTDTTITVTEPTPPEEYEYSNDGGETWQDSPVFPDLTPDTGYPVSVRRKGTDDTPPGPVSGPVSVRTKPGPEAPPNIKAESTDTTITVTEPTPPEEYEYSNDGGETWQDSPVFPDLTPDTEYPVSVRRKGTDDTPPGPVSGPVSVRTKRSNEDSAISVYTVLQNLDGTWSAPAQPTETAKDAYIIPALTGFRATAYSLGTYQANEAARSVTSEGRSVRLNDYEKLYVYYARNIYRLTFYSDAEGETILRRESVLYGAPLAQYETVKPEERANYTFAAWSPDSNIQVSAFRDKQGNLTRGVTVIDWETTMPDKDTDAYPIWIHDRLEIHLDLGAYDSLNDREWYNPEKFDANTPAEMSKDQAREFTVDLNERVAMKELTAATRAGYRLAGWYTQDGILWNGENWADLPYADGFDETVGWGVTPTYCDTDETGEVVIETNTSRAYNYYTVTLTARWKPIEVTVAYVGEGENLPVDSAAYRLGDAIIIGSAPVAPDRMIFIGWRDANGTLHSPGEEFDFADWTLQTDNVITLRSAFINAPDYAITFDSNGGTAVAPIVNYALNETIAEREPTTTRSGYDFIGWYDERGDKVDFPLTLTVAENRTFTAQWTRNQYTITFKTNGGAPVAPITGNYGTQIDKTVVSERLHYVFTGWFPALPDTMPARDLTVEAQWKPAEYTLRWRTEEDAPIQTITAIYGGLVERPTDPVKKGYDFTGWNPTFPTYMPDDYPVITGQWTKNAAPSGGGGSSSSTTYQITVEKAENGKAEASAYRARNGVLITVTPAPFEGYVTESVSVQTSRGQSVETVKNADGTYSFRMPASDVTVRLSFAADSAPDDNMSGGGDVPNPGGGDPDDSGVSKWLIADKHPVYINGFSDGTFRPNDSITRAQTAMMIYRLLKDKDIEKTEDFFDMDGTEWYAEATYVLCSLGVIQGYSDGSFQGQNTITRAAFTAILARFAANEDNVDPDALQFADVPPEHWAHSVITRAASYGWIDGYSDGTFHPAEPITRAAACAIINRMLGREADRDYVAAHGDELKSFSDVRDPNAWYYYNVLEAANEHTFKKSNGKELWNQ